MPNHIGRWKPSSNRTYDVKIGLTQTDIPEFNPIDELLLADDLTMEQIKIALVEIEWQYPHLSSEIADVRFSLGL